MDSFLVLELLFWVQKDPTVGKADYMPPYTMIKWYFMDPCRGVFPLLALFGPPEGRGIAVSAWRINPRAWGASAVPVGLFSRLDGCQDGDLNPDPVVRVGLPDCIRSQSDATFYISLTLLVSDDDWGKVSFNILQVNQKLRKCFSKDEITLERLSSGVWVPQREHEDKSGNVKGIRLFVFSSHTAWMMILYPPPWTNFSV